MMRYLKDLKSPFGLSALIFMISVLNLWKIDFYAAVLSGLYFVLGSASNIGKHYFDLTQQRKSLKAAFKIFVDPPAAFVLVLASFYVLSEDFHWIFTGTAAFLTLILFVIAYSDWMQEKEKEQKKN